MHWNSPIVHIGQFPLIPGWHTLELPVKLRERSNAIHSSAQCIIIDKQPTFSIHGKSLKSTTTTVHETANLFIIIFFFKQSTSKLRNVLTFINDSFLSGAWSSATVHENRPKIPRILERQGFMSISVKPDAISSLIAYLSYDHSCGIDHRACVNNCEEAAVGLATCNVYKELI